MFFGIITERLEHDARCNFQCYDIVIPKSVNGSEASMKQNREKLNGRIVASQKRIKLEKEFYWLVIL